MKMQEAERLADCWKVSLVTYRVMCADSLYCRPYFDVGESRWGVEVGWRKAIEGQEYANAVGIVDVPSGCDPALVFRLVDENCRKSEDSILGRPGYPPSPERVLEALDTK